MSVKNFIPIPFLGTHTLKSLSISLHSRYDFGSAKSYNEPNISVRDYKFFDLKGLATFLIACSVLEEFSAEFYGSPPFVPNLPDDGYRVQLDRVRSVAFVFDCCSSTIITSMLNAVRFPNVSAMSIRIEAPEGPQARLVDIAQNVIGALFPDTSTFGNVVQLQLEVQIYQVYSAHNYNFLAAGGSTSIQVRLPFSSLPKLKHFDLTTHCTLELVNENIPFPPLQMLRLINCPNVSREWVVDILRRHGDSFPKERLEVIVDPTS